MAQLSALSVVTQRSLLLTYPTLDCRHTLETYLDYD